MKLKALHKCAAFTFTLGEHVCALGYAAGELAIRSHVVLYYASGLLLSSGAFLIIIKFLDRKDS